MNVIGRVISVLIVMLILASISATTLNSIEDPPHSSASTLEPQVDRVGMPAISTQTTQATLFSDNFTDGDIVGWTVSSGSWEVVNGELAQGDDSYWPVIAWTGDRAWRDYVVQVKVKPTGGVGQVFVLFRYVDEQNFYLFGIREDFDDIVWNKVVEGNWGQEVSSSRIINSGQWYDLKVVVQGDHIQGYVDGSLYVAILDSDIDKGAIALDTHVAAARFDDVSVSTCPEEPQPPSVGIICFADPTYVAIGEAVRIYGFCSFETSVSLQFVRPDGSVFYRSVQSNESGSFESVLLSDRVGQWSVTASLQDSSADSASFIVRETIGPVSLTRFPTLGQVAEFMAEHYIEWDFHGTIVVRTKLYRRILAVDAAEDVFVEELGFTSSILSSVQFIAIEFGFHDRSDTMRRTSEMEISGKFYRKTGLTNHTVIEWLAGSSDFDLASWVVSTGNAETPEWLGSFEHIAMPGEASGLYANPQDLAELPLRVVATPVGSLQCRMKQDGNSKSFFELNSGIRAIYIAEWNGYNFGSYRGKTVERLTSTWIQHVSKQKVAYITAKYSDSTHLRSIEELREKAELVSNYFREQSYGLEDVAFEFVPGDWRSLDKTFQAYQTLYPDREVMWDTIRDDAIRLSGVNEWSYNAIVVLQPERLRSYASGVGGKKVITVDSETYGTWAHELGHSMYGWEDYYLDAQRPSSASELRGNIWFWGLMGDGCKTNPAAPVVAYNKEKAGWLEYKTIASEQYGEYPIVPLDDMQAGDDVYRYETNTGIYRYYIFEGRHPLDGVVKDSNEEENPKLNEIEGVLLYGVEQKGSLWWKKDYLYSLTPGQLGSESTVHDYDIFTVTLLPGDTVRDEFAMVSFSCVRRDSQLFVSINPHIPTDRVLVSLSNEMVTSANTSSSLQGVSAVSGLLADVDLHAYTLPNGNHVGMNYSSNIYELGISGARASGNVTGGPEWISVPAGVQVRYAVGFRYLSEQWQEGLDASGVNATFDLRLVYYDQDGHSWMSEIITGSLEPNGTELFDPSIVENPDGSFLVRIVPEFPFFTLLMLMIVTSFTAASIRKRRRNLLGRS